MRASTVPRAGVAMAAAVVLAAGACSGGEGDDAAPGSTTSSAVPATIDTSVLEHDDINNALGEIEELAVFHAGLVADDPAGTSLPVRAAANRVQLALREYEEIVEVSRDDLARLRRGVAMARDTAALYGTATSIISYVWEHDTDAGAEIGQRVLELAQRFRSGTHRLLQSGAVEEPPELRQAWLAHLRSLDVPPLSELVVGDDPLRLAPPNVMVEVVAAYEAEAFSGIEQASWVDLGLRAHLEALRLHETFRDAPPPLGCAASADVVELVRAGLGPEMWPDELGTRSNRGVYLDC